MFSAQDVMDVFHSRALPAPPDIDTITGCMQFAWMLSDLGRFGELASFLQTRPHIHLGMLAGYSDRPSTH